MTSLHGSASRLRQPLGVAIALVLVDWLLLPPLRAQTGAAPGTISGSVGNAAIHNMLQGASVELRSQKRQVMTDSSGHFVLTDESPGPAELVVFQKVEAIKAATPDMSAESIGGTINLITRSPLGMVSAAVQFGVKGEF